MRLKLLLFPVFIACVTTASKPYPEVKSVSVSQAPAVDSTRYIVHYIINKALRTTDSVRVKFIRDSVVGLPGFIQNTYRRTINDSVTYTTVKVYGQAIHYSACVSIRAVGVIVGKEKCSMTSTNFPIPIDTVPPVVDTVFISL